MEEIWKDIEGYEKYQVSNLGRVRSLNFRRTGKVQVLKPGKNKCGYLLVNLCKDGKLKSCLVHRLVAQAFLPNLDNLPQVNHRDEDKENNLLDNLEFCTSKYNNNYGSHSQRMSKTRSIPVAQLTKEGELITVYYGTREASRQTGISQGNISECCRGKLKTCGGFIWKYVNQ